MEPGLISYHFFGGSFIGFYKSSDRDRGIYYSFLPPLRLSALLYAQHFTMLHYLCSYIL